MSAETEKAGGIPDRVPEEIPDRVPGGIPDRAPGEIPDRVPGEIRPRQKERVVRLTIRGSQTDPDGNIQENTVEYTALYSRENDRHWFRYLEEGEEQSWSTLFVSRTAVRHIRGGKRTGSEMLFDPSRPETHCDYRTSYGSIPMKIRTGRIALLDGGPAGVRIRARVQYRLVLDDDWGLDCLVTIRADGADAQDA